MYVDNHLVVSFSLFAVLFRQEHRRRHTGEQPYHCPECSMKFKTRNSYKRHLSTKHPNVHIKIKMARRPKEANVIAPHVKMEDKALQLER